MGRTRCCNTKCECIALKVQMRDLWTDHYYQTREVITDAATQNPCFAVNLEALLTNQDNIGANFGKLVCNAKAGSKLAVELRRHIDIAVLIVVALINQQPIDQLYQLWRENADAIAAIYHKYNRCIRYETIKELLYGHLDTTAAEAVAIIAGDCVLSQTTGAEALHHIREMVDYIDSKFKC